MKKLITLLFLLSFLPVSAQDIQQNDSVEVLMIDTLSIGSSYEIIRKSQGCFHYHQDTLKISRTSDGLFLSTGGSEKKLEDKLLENYKRFERELLYQSHPGGCTTTVEYRLKTIAFEVLLLNDSSCEWDAFDNLVGYED